MFRWNILPPLKSFRFYPIAQIRSLGLLCKIMKDRHPDILHTYFFWSIIYGRLLKRLGLIDTLVENREDHGFRVGEA